MSSLIAASRAANSTPGKPPDMIFLIIVPNPDILSEPVSS
jgi:hypothetical protein